jgi:hypothetical protein
MYNIGKEMTTLLKINIWKKGTNKETSMPDYQIEIEEGDSYKIRELIDVIIGDK